MTPVSFTMPSAEDEGRVRPEWNATHARYPAAAVHELVERQICATPNRIAVRFGATSRTYAELGRRANKIAHALRAMGAGRGQRIGICVERGVEMLVCVLGVLKTGAAYVPLDPAFPEQRLRFMAEDAELAVIVSASDLAGAFSHPRDSQLLLDADALSIKAQPDSSLSGDAGGAVLPEDAAYVIYTSGSTGRPKGVVVPHRAVVNFLTSMAREPGFTSDDVLLAVTTLSFDIAVLELLLPLVNGGTVVIAGREDTIDGDRLAELIRMHRVTVMQATPVTWRALLAAQWRPGAGFKALVGGEALPKDLAASLIESGVELWNMYGPTETTVWSTCGRVADAEGAITIGRPIANTTVWIRDAQQQLCPVGVPGEICIGGAGVALGYWNRPGLSAERFLPGPSDGPGVAIYRTGDLGRWRVDGTLEHLGRLDDQVKLRGFRIELGEIEAGILRHAAVRDAAVMLREDTPGDKRLVAYIVADATYPDLVQQVRALARESLPEYMVPSQFVPIDRMPLTPNGKRDRNALPAPLPESPRLGGTIAPRTPTEHSVAAIWASVLKQSEVGVEDNFFDIGGSSFLVMEIVSQIRALNIEISPLAVFHYPTVRSLAEHLEGRVGDAIGVRAIALARKQRAALGRQRNFVRGA